MTKKRKVLIAIAAIIAASLVYIACDLLAPHFWLGSFSSAQIDGFVCETETKVISQSEQERTEKRAKNLNRALKNANGLYASWGRHNWFSISFNEIRPEKLYRLQKLLTIEDWEILAQMYIDKREHYEIIHSLFAVNGERAIAILECKVNNLSISEEKTAMLIANLNDIKELSKSERFINEYLRQNTYKNLFKIFSPLLFLLIPVVIFLIGV
ncbi:MAG: hypothetical protein LBO72_05845, partial [Helicobacteraceae bacterium]|nr:hypothetical protein [Helicobacteraceae bacterium]